MPSAKSSRFRSAPKGSRVHLDRVPPSTSVMGVNEGIPPHFEVEARSRPVVRGRKMEALARRLWVMDYRPEYSLEEEGYRVSGMFGAMSMAAGLANGSTYQDQQRASPSSQAARDVKRNAMVMRWCAEGTHESNHANMPFSIAARSAAHVGHKSSIGSWQESGNVLSRDTALRLIGAMVKVRPPLPVRRTWRIVCFLFDQVYRVKNCGAKKNRSTAQERVDGTGAVRRATLKSFESQVYINSVEVPLPLSMAALTQPDVDQLRRYGPFPGAWDQVYPMLAIDKVC
jgi:hypothetical protein